MCRELHRFHVPDADLRAERVIRTLLLGGASVMALAGLFLTIVRGGVWSVGACIAGAVLLGLFLYAVWLVQAPKTARKQFEQDPHNADPIVLDADETGLTFVSAVGATHIAWAGIGGVVHLKEYVAVVDAEAQFRFIPRDAFASPTALETFVRFVESRANAPSTYP
jgi:hypothetical protein